MHVQTEGKMHWIVIGIITAILGLLLAFIAPNLIHMVLFSAGDLIYIKTPVLSNILFSIGIFFLVVFCFLMYFPQRKTRFIAFGIIFLSFVITIFSLTNYSVIRDERIVHNELFSLSQTVYEWSDVENAALLKGTEEIPYETLVLTMNDGKELVYDRDPNLRSEFDRVDYILQTNGIYYSLEDRN
ncbi:hypothetical protein [Jeotgalibacillus soli]|uniref:Uncharacterized protein n=1 Tax=Jeotgalibacillus soli TaxID=889306 RepID=A0A0C2W6J0_9BACL|nr:hypothetical protein [Jeotgalibacillus soli]KIL52196.1 hypothetical protein KP78_05660 [Jeotgalibacillus soli]